MVSPVLVIVPVVASPFWTPSTSHNTVPVPPVRVAVIVRDCEVVIAERWGERATVTLEVGGGSVGGGVAGGGGGGGVLGGGVFDGGAAAVVPPPHEIKPGVNSNPAIASTKTGIFFRRVPRVTDDIQESPLIRDFESKS